jgi:hypothetical protein
MKLPSLAWIRRSTLVAGGALAMAAVVMPTVSQASEQSLPVDTQVYISRGPVDPHNDDSGNIHINASGGRETARAYFHVNLGYLPEGATLSALEMTLVPTAPSAAGAPDQNNFRNTSAILMFCILEEPIPAPFKSNHAPLKDNCAGASKTGEWQPDGKYKVNLKDLATKWASGSNHGAVIMPLLASPQETYQVSFDKGRTSTRATFTPPAASAGGALLPAPELPAPQAAPEAPWGAVLGPPPALDTKPAPAAPPAPKDPVIHHQKGRVQAAPSSGNAAGWQLWAVALVAAAAACVGLLAYPLSQALSPAAGGIRAGLTSQLRVHPRLFAVTGGLAVYSLTFGTYSLAQGNSPLNRAPGVTAENPAGEPSTSPSADNSPSPEATSAAGTAAAGTAPSEGTRQTINGTSVLVPADGGPPLANLFSAADDRIGITPAEIRLCGHAALTYADAFQTKPEDFNVFWQSVNEEKAGIYGRRVTMEYQNDNYNPETAVRAAETCKSKGIFMLLGGIGFDQIPSVRIWAEQNRMLYLHHVATEKDADKLRYSFAPLPTVEDAGRLFGDLYLRKFSGKKLGILHRGSVFWDPGYFAFRARLRQAGQEGNIVYERPVQQNQGSYANELVGAKSAGAEVMWSWENALDTPEMIKQAKAQRWDPPWLVFPFNLELTVLGNDALNPPLVGVAAWPAYTKGQYGGAFASYAEDIREFERQYAKFRPGTDLGGAGGDLLFLNWVAQKALYQQFLDCGKDCTRNRFAGMMLTGYKKTVSPNCPADWSRVPRRGGFGMEIFEAAAGPGGRPMWQPLARCVERY